MMKCFRRPEPSPESDVLIELDSVGMARGRKTVLADVNLTIRRGDVLLITGPNGGGKTTLLRILLGLLSPTSGHVRRNMSGCRVGYLPQKNSVDSSFPITVSEVIASGLLGEAGVDRSELAQRVGETLHTVGLEEHASKPIGALSGGQQQRALLGRAIISRPALLVLDEPLSYVDTHFGQHIFEILRTLAAAGTTMLIVSHDVASISKIATRHLFVDREATERV